MSIQFKFEWEEPGFAKGDELRATWARFELLVNGRPVTRVLDRTIRAERAAVYVPLFPLAEWLAHNWFFLFAEVGSRHTRDRSYAGRHSLRFAGEGYALPDFQFLPAGELMDLRWFPYRPANHLVEFLDGGEAFSPIVEVQARASEFVQAVVDRLAAENVSAPSLTEEWQAIQSLPQDERLFAEAAASLGVDPFDLRVKDQNAILDAASQVPGEVLPELLAITRPKDIATQIHWFRGAVSELEPITSALTDLPELASEIRRIPSSAERPFEHGLKVAKCVREKLGINGHPVVGLDGLARLFGDFKDFRDSGIMLQPETRQQVHAVALADGPPKFLLTKTRSDSRRFALSRAVYNYLIGAFASVDIVADSYFAKDKASRKFAAELLAPAEGLRKRISSAVVDEDEITALAEEYDVSTQVIENQLINNGIAEIAPTLEAN
ncbi:MAG: hypothetical protein QOG84_489 [Sphingomonadales bacterium]|jgi:hypothetical protein|nr:hypothetical protein [Sphingomonadales bacterium]